jgi:NAD(P)-dependent dehydrogenase (short-subunit alcohol dehydrogenase family)
LVPVAPAIALITQRSLVQIRPPQPNPTRGYSARCNPVFLGGCAGVASGRSVDDFRTQLEAQTPLGRIGQPEDIAPTAVFLASPDSAWITGETLHVAGGLR